ncbi:unnamed protein product [Cladocopium goreaui]|uniref:Uncharacterized protein n=1 Tax=Cladocopium goreaui TaxID=2562237 RepID=A0A9P1DRS7_9DINO|nr:unnamed protein product [Cladocopium goreaui]
MWQSCFLVADLGRVVRAEAWILRKLVYLFNRAAKRGHRPREAGIRELMQVAGIDVPDLSPRGPRPKCELGEEPEPNDPADDGDEDGDEDEEWEEEEAEDDPTVEPHEEPMDDDKDSSDDDTNDDEWQSRLPPGVHDIVKCRVNGGECRKCGKVGSWDFIKSAPCQPCVPANVAIPNSEPGPPPVSGHGENLGKMLDEALKNGDEEAAFEIVAKMETQQAEESLQDQQLILELMEQELELMDAMEQLETLESLQRLEDEEAELEQAILLSKQPLEKVDPKIALRPPATPCNSSTTPPVVHKPVVAQPPSVCPDNLDTLPMPTLEIELPVEPESQTRKKKEDVEEDQDEQKEDKVCKDEKPGKVSKTKGKKVETTKGRKGKKEEGQASDGKEKPKLDDEETVGKKLKPKVPPCESQDRKVNTTLAPKSKARKRKPTQDDTGLDKRDSSSKGSTTTKDQSDEKPSSSKDKPSRRRKARAPKGSTSSKSKNSEVEKTKSKRAKGDEKNSDAKAAAKAKLSRKSAAYHRAKVAALKEGKDEKTAKDLGREVTNASTVFPSWHLGSAGAAAPTSSWACLQPAASSEAISRWDQMTSYRLKAVTEQQVWTARPMAGDGDASWRTYPVQYGRNLLHAFENHIGSCPVLGDPALTNELMSLQQGDCETARRERVEALRRKLSNVARPEGEELQRLFRAHGSFETLEVQVRKKFTKAIEKAKSGGWFTKQYLESKEHWSMVAKAVQWAKASNKHRVSPVHGEEEIYLILSETFQAKEVEQEEMNREGNMEVQDEEGSLFQTEIPDLAAGDDAVLASTLPSSGSSGPGQGNAPAVAVGSTSAVMSFKLATQMEAVVQKMQAKYEDLTAELSEATVKPDEIELFVECTKIDVNMNSLVMRGKGMKSSSSASNAPSRGGGAPKPKTKAKAAPKPKRKSRHTFTTRLLYTVLPSENYAPRSRTHDGLLQLLVDDLVSLQRDGIEAKWS